MIIIGMTGPIGHGKSTFAKALKNQEPSTIRFESSLIIAEVADAFHAAMGPLPAKDDIDSINNWLKPLPGIIQDTVHTNCSFSQLEIQLNDVERHPVEYEKLLLHIENLGRAPRLAKEKITSENKESYRPILQWLGGYLVKRVDPNIWYKEIIRRVEKAAEDGYKICVIGGLRFPSDANMVREAGGILVKIYRPGHLQYDMMDPTERERDNIRVDATIMSTGTIGDMDKCALVVLHDIETNNLQHIYRSSDFAD